MAKNLMYSELAKYYDLIYKKGSKKDYKKEVDFIDDIIKKNKIKGKKVIEVAAGTGNHTEYLLKKDYKIIAAIDLSENMLKLYKKKYPKIKTIKANMQTMNLGMKADIILCLFSSIGYNLNIKALEKTFTKFYKHLNPGGIIIVDTGFTKIQIKKNYVHTIHASKGNLDIIRVGKSIFKGNLLDLLFTYVIFKNDKVYTSVDKHTMVIFSKEQILKTMERVGLKSKSKMLGRRSFFYGIKK